MLPELFTIFGVTIQSYGVSKALAILVAGLVLTRAFRRHNLSGDAAWSLVMHATIWGFVGAKLYFLAEHADSFMWHHLGGMGFTWYGGMIGGTIAALVVIRRQRLPLGLVSGLVAVPLSLAYGIGRLGCLLAGDGTYGAPTDVPWGMAFPNGVVPTMVPVHPTPLYEALAAFAIAGLLTLLSRRIAAPAVFGTYLILTGATRLLVEFVRINDPALFGLTQPQLWSLLAIAIGAAILFTHRRRAGFISDRGKATRIRDEQSEKPVTEPATQ